MTGSHKLRVQCTRNKYNKHCKKQCFVSGSGWIRIQIASLDPDPDSESGSGIRIRIRNPDSESGSGSRFGIRIRIQQLKLSFFKAVEGCTDRVGISKHLFAGGGGLRGLCICLSVILSVRCYVLFNHTCGNLAAILHCKFKNTAK